MSLGNERVAWFNGRILRESEVVIPFRDQGFLKGDAVFDMTRSFGHSASNSTSPASTARSNISTSTRA
jgi:branched-subunit amino acid aminotransferase/4-amino-4-deoxychorismate lyase